jgi:hypothetical protein
MLLVSYRIMPLPAALGREAEHVLATKDKTGSQMDTRAYRCPGKIYAVGTFILEETRSG